MEKTIYYRDTAGIVHASAIVSWASDLKVNVSITYNESSSWRIKPQGTNTTPVLTVTNGGTSGSFSATDGLTYVFQVVINGTWTNSTDGSGTFTVDSGNSDSDDGDEGGDSGGSGGPDADYYYYLWVLADKGTKITIHRTWTESSSEAEGSYFGELKDWDVEDEDDRGLWYGYKVWYKDFFYIDVEALDGYVLDTYEIDGNTFNYDLEGLSYNEEQGNWGFLSNEDPWIYVSATAVSTVRIYDGEGFNPYSCCIYNGLDWDLYTPYIYRNKNWDRYN